MPLTSSKGTLLKLCPGYSASIDNPSSLNVALGPTLRNGSEPEN